MLVGALLLSTGCAKSDKLDIGGRVTRKDGSAVASAKVTYRAPRTGRTATGITDSEGRYVLGTSKAGEGIPAESYYVTISENQGTEDAPLPATVNLKYRAADSSGLSADVVPAGETSFDFVLDPP